MSKKNDKETKTIRCKIGRSSLACDGKCSIIRIERHERTELVAGLPVHNTPKIDYMYFYVHINDSAEFPLITEDPLNGDNDRNNENLGELQIVLLSVTVIVVVILGVAVLICTKLHPPCKSERNAESPPKSGASKFYVKGLNDDSETKISGKQIIF